MSLDYIDPVFQFLGYYYLFCTTQLCQGGMKTSDGAAADYEDNIAFTDPRQLLAV